MATKGGGQLFLNEKCANDNDGRQFTNFNLNQNYKCHDLIPVQSYNKSNFNNKFVSHKTVVDKNSESRNEESKHGGLYLKPWNNRNLFGKEKQNIIRKPWNNEISSNFSNNDSTLSLHITAYENLIESSNQKTDSSKKLKETKTLLLAPKLRDPFEYPRQMDDQNGAGSKGTPEIMQFKASQKLLALNQKDESSDVKTDRTQKIGAHELPIVAGSKGVYEAKELIDEGAYGQVYKATNQNKLYALKVGDIENDLRILKQITHSTSIHIPQLYDFGGLGEKSFMALEYLGINLATFIRDNKPSPRLLLVLAGHCLQALEALHKMEILHKDIKSNNFILGPKNSITEHSVRIIDFGMSTEDGEIGNDSKTVWIYKSCDEHLGYRVSRKTELETLFYVFAHWFRDLPWQNLMHDTNKMGEYKYHIQFHREKFNEFFGYFNSRSPDQNYFYGLICFLKEIENISLDAVPNYDIFYLILDLAYQRAKKAEKRKDKKYLNETMEIKKFKKFEIGQAVLKKENEFGYIIHLESKMLHGSWSTNVKHIEVDGVFLYLTYDSKKLLNFKCSKCPYTVSILKHDESGEAIKFDVGQKVNIYEVSKPHSDDCTKIQRPPQIDDLKVGDFLDSFKIIEKADGENCYKVSSIKFMDGKEYLGKASKVNGDLSMMQNELRVLLKHGELEKMKHLIKLLHHGTRLSHHFLVLEDFGPSLEQVQSQKPDKKFTTIETCKIGLQCLEALQQFHSLGFCHNAVSPKTFSMQSADPLHILLTSYGNASPINHDMKENPFQLPYPHDSSPQRDICSTILVLDYLREGKTRSTNNLKTLLNEMPILFNEMLKRQLLCSNPEYESLKNILKEQVNAINRNLDLKMEQEIHDAANSELQDEVFYDAS